MRSNLNNRNPDQIKDKKKSPTQLFRKHAEAGWGF
jgi:hypothetical protein